jgi:hypothetical protein
MKTEDKIWWKQFRDNLRNTVSNDEYLVICELHSFYFNHPLVKPCKCNPEVIQSYIDDLNELYLKL